MTLGGVNGAELGRAGEARAGRLLESMNWTIVARNYRTRVGEIDIIAFKEGILAFVEVKTWRFFGASELEKALGPQKRRRIVETAKIFLTRHREYSNVKVRFDLIFLKEGEEPRLIESAFMGEL